MSTDVKITAVNSAQIIEKMQKIANGAILIRTNIEARRALSIKDLQPERVRTEAEVIDELEQKEQRRRRVALRNHVRKNNVGRNQRCPCNSGEKFKRCCGATGNESG